MVSIDDAYSSTDGKSHTVSLLLENEQDFAAPSREPRARRRQLPIPRRVAVFVVCHRTDTVAPSTSNAPASILVAEQRTRPMVLRRRGAITYGQAPSSAFVFGAMPFGASTFDVPYTSFTVPGRRAASRSDIVYSTEFTLAATQQDALTAEDALQAAAVSFNSPSSGATVSSSPVTVTGSASAGSGVKSVTVNGVKATVSGGLVLGLGAADRRCQYVDGGGDVRMVARARARVRA